MANKFHNGMLSGRKIFFHNVNKSNSVDKIKRIFKRLEAEIVEIYDGVNIDIVITDEISHSAINHTDRKRKNNSPIGFQPKRNRLDSCIKNILLNNKINESIENNTINFNRSDSQISQFLSIAKEKGWKIKSTNEVWQWLSKYYKWLFEADEPDAPIYRNPNFDSYYRVKYLNSPALKICDPFGDAQPLVLENYSIEKSVWWEFINEKHEVSCELRKSISTSRKMRKHLNNNNEESGYCENCRKYYQYLSQHINTTEHSSFAENSANFREIDYLITRSPTISDFFINRKSLWDQHKKSKISLLTLPSSMKQISIHENPDNSILLKTQLLSPKQINVESNSSSTSSSSYTDSSSCESSTASDFSSSESKNNIKIKNNYISSTPINKIKRPDFFSPDSISTEEQQQQQSQISSHVNDIIENLDSQLLTNDDYDDEIYPQLNRSLRSICPKNSPIISRRFDWCKECKRNHVPIDDIDGYQCQLSPLKIENFKSMQFSVDIDETCNNGKTDGKLSSNNNDEFIKNSVLCKEIIDLNLNTEISDIDAISSGNISCVIISNFREDLAKINPGNLTTHLVKTQSNDYSVPQLVDEMDIEKVIEKQKPIDEIVKISNDCSQNSVTLSLIDIENNNLQVIKKDSYETNCQLNEICSTNDLINDKIEYDSTVSDISEAEVENENNSKFDTIDKIDFNEELSPSSSPANTVFIPCSINLEKIKNEDDVNVHNVLTESANEINFHLVSELSEEQSDSHRQIQSTSQLSYPDSSDYIPDQDYSESSYYSENISQSNNPNINHNRKKLSVRKYRKTLELRGDLDINSPISGKRKAAIAANRGIENANRFFDKDIRKTIKTLQDTYEPFVYNPREILNKLNYSPNSSNGASKKSLLKERNV